MYQKNAEFYPDELSSLSDDEWRSFQPVLRVHLWSTMKAKIYKLYQLQNENFKVNRKIQNWKKSAIFLDHTVRTMKWYHN